MKRLAGVTAVIILTILCVPAALTPGFNGADLIITVSPLAVLAIGWPRAPQPRARCGGALPPPPPHHR